MLEAELSGAAGAEAGHAHESRVTAVRLHKYPNARPCLGFSAPSSLSKMNSLRPREVHTQSLFTVKRVRAGSQVLKP